MPGEAIVIIAAVGCGAIAEIINKKRKEWAIWKSVLRGRKRYTHQ